jgi:uncharacterized membrane protein HdeD (DUF308 family)
MSKTTLLVVGIILVIMGILAFIPAWTIGSEPAWHSIVKIVIGLVSIYISRTDK